MNCFLIFLFFGKHYFSYTRMNIPKENEMLIKKVILSEKQQSKVRDVRMESIQKKKLCCQMSYSIVRRDER